MRRTTNGRFPPASNKVTIPLGLEPQEAAMTIGKSLNVFLVTVAFAFIGAIAVGLF